MSGHGGEDLVSRNDQCENGTCNWPSTDDLASKMRYANSLGISLDEAESLNVKSMVFAGARIMARDQKWGVILLDSLKAGQIVDSSYQRKLLGECASLISSLLNRVDI